MFPKQLFPDRAFPSPLFPEGRGNPACLNYDVTDRLHPEQVFPERLFPSSIGELIHKYTKILLYIQNSLQSLYDFNITRAPIVVHDQPFPLNGGPIAYIYPEESETIEGQHNGDGRYFYGFRGSCTVRVAGGDWRDYVYSSTIALTDLNTGLLKASHAVIDKLDIEFAVDSDGLNLTQEPIILDSHSPVSYRAKNTYWTGIDLRFVFPYTVDFLRPDTTNDPTGSIPAPTDMAELLKSVQTRIINQDFLNEYQTVISVFDEVFPLVGGPFCVISPLHFRQMRGHKIGAGRDFALMEGYFSVSPCVQNVTDISGYADGAIAGCSTQISLYSCVQYLIEQLCLSFLSNPAGDFIAQSPLDLVSIGRPRYLKQASNYLTLPLIFKVIYRERLT